MADTKMQASKGEKGGEMMGSGMCFVSISVLVCAGETDKKKMVVYSMFLFFFCSADLLL